MILKRINQSGCLPKTHQNSVKIIEEFSEKIDLVDVWRVLHPKIIRYTWRRRRPKVQCRLDFFLANQNVANITTLLEIHPGYKTDHSMITLKIPLHRNPRGPGLWKLNTSLFWLKATVLVKLRHLYKKHRMNIEMMIQSTLSFYRRWLN